VTLFSHGDACVMLAGAAFLLAALAGFAEPLTNATALVGV